MPGRLMEKLTALRILGKSPLGAYLRANESIWRRLPQSIRTGRSVGAYGRLMHRLVCQQGNRRQYFDTFFFRNRPELELIRRLATTSDQGRAMRVAVLGCGNGAEAYSMIWTMRSARPAQEIVMKAVDISGDALAVAQTGIYRLGVSEVVTDSICERMTRDEMAGMFEGDGVTLRIKAWLREGIAWQVGDAGDPRLSDVLGRQDLVVANRFLCHMDPVEAERCLRNIARLVDGGGYLFVSGVDLDVRTRVAVDLGWTPVPELMEDIHEGDRSLRVSWPWHYWGLEPLDRGRPDWRVRYASVFRLGASRTDAPTPLSARAPSAPPAPR